MTAPKKKKAEKKSKKENKPQEDLTVSVALSALLKCVLRFGAFTFLFWLFLIPLLSLLWGSSIFEIQEEVAARIEFLKSIKSTYSPSLGLLAEIDWADAMGAGALLGFLYYNLPIAIFLAFFESVIGSSKNQFLKIVLRVIMLIGLFFFFYDCFAAFSSSWLMSIYLMIVFTVLPFGLGLAIEKLEEKVFSFSRLRHWVLACCVILFVSLPLLTHPAWHLMIVQGKYEKANILTQLRDWFLLNEEGESFVNDWYYDSAVLASELDGITVFQPILVGVCDVAINRNWYQQFQVYFARGKGQVGNRLQLVRQKTLEQGLQALKEKRVHVLIANVNTYVNEDSFYEGIDPDSLVFLSNVSAKTKTPQGYAIKTLRTFNTRVNTANSHYFVNPIRKRYNMLKDRGLNSEQMEMFKHFQGSFLDFVLPLDDKGKPAVPIALFLTLVIVMLGIAYIVCLFIVCLCHTKAWPLLLLLGLFGLWMTPSVLHHFSWWSQLGEPVDGASEIPEIKQLELHILAQQPNAEVTKLVLSEEPAKDSRLMMWQMEFLGEAYRLSDPKSREAGRFRLDSKTREEIRLWLAPLIINYKTSTVNVRYKLVRTMANVPEFHDQLEALIASEKQLYVRFYAEERGFGREKMNYPSEASSAEKDFWKP